VKPAVSDSLVSSIDVAQTVLAAVSGKPDQSLPGVNLLDPQAVANRGPLFGEIFEHTAVDIRKPAANLQYRWVVDGNWKLIVPNAANVKDGVNELYDLAKDPTEKENLAAKHPDRVAELTKKLDSWWKPE
jgi:uncharacterized sulfatase